MKTLDILNSCGAVAFGIVVGCILRFFLERFERYDLKALTGLLGVPIGGTILTFISGLGIYGTPSYAIGLALGLIVYQFLWTKFPARLPMRRSGLTTQFVIQDLTKRVEIDDDKGEEARMIRNQIIKVTNDIAVPKLLICQIFVEGDVEDLKVTSTTPGVAGVVNKRGGLTEVYAQLPAAVKKGQILDIEITYKMRNTFKQAEEFLGHEVTQDTASAALEVRFPAKRVCRSAALYLMFGGIAQDLPDNKPQVAGDGSSVKVRLPSDMRIGHSYRLQWLW